MSRLSRTANIHSGKTQLSRLVEEVAEGSTAASESLRRGWMRLLLDTQVYLWYPADSPKLSRQARVILASAEEVFVSAALI